jgi:hypothetical protein
MPTKTATIDQFPDPSYAPTALLGHNMIGRYGFAIVRDGLISPLEAVALRLAPQSLEEAEEAATIITPMQGGAQLRERRGQIGKDINLSGTTGFRPEPGSPLTIDPQTGLPALELPVTGYYQFHKLRNLFRKYWAVHQKGTPQEKEAIDFLFYNPADLEMWIVEPLSFRLSRSNSSPMTRRYSIVLKTICAAPSVKIPLDFASKTFSTTGSWLKELFATLRSVVKTLTEAVKALRGAVTALTESVRSLVEGLCSMVDQVVGATTALLDSVKTFISLPGDMLLRINSTVDTIFDAAELALIGLPTTAIDSLVLIRQNIDAIGARPELFEKRWEDQYAEAIANFTAEYQSEDEVVSPANITGVSEGRINRGDSLWSIAQRELGSPVYAHVLALFNKLRPPYIAPSANERAAGLLAPGDTILIPVFGGGTGSATSTLSTRADPAYAGAPSYVAADSLRVDGAEWRPDAWKGFTVSIVQGAGLGAERLVAGNTADTLTLDANWTLWPTTASLFRIYLKRFEVLPTAGSEESIGRDLALTPGNDLAVAAQGDAATLVGTQNFKQACQIKIATTQGTLPLHPWFGIEPAFGQRGTPDNLFHFRYNALQTFLQDPRVESVENMTVTLTRDVGELEARIKVRGGEYQPIKTRL